MTRGSLVRTMMLVVLLLGRPARAEPAPVSLEINLPADQKLASLQVELDSAVVALVAPGTPAIVEISPAKKESPHEFVLSALTGGPEIPFNIWLDDKGVQIQPGPRACPNGIKVRTRPERHGAEWHWTLRFDGGGKCEREARAWGSAEGKVTMKFVSDPQGATVYYPVESGLVFTRRDWVAQGPAPLVMGTDFRVGQDLSVFFKKARHADCRVSLHMERDAEGRWLSVQPPGGERQLFPPAGDDKTVPVVRCTLRPLRGAK